MCLIVPSILLWINVTFLHTTLSKVNVFCTLMFLHAHDGALSLRGVSLRLYLVILGVSGVIKIPESPSIKARF